MDMLAGSKVNHDLLYYFTINFIQNLDLELSLGYIIKLWIESIHKNIIEKRRGIDCQKGRKVFNNIMKACA